MSLKSQRLVQKRKRPEYELLSSQGYSDGGLGSSSEEEETFFSSPALTATKGKNQLQPWAIIFNPSSWSKKTRGIVSAGILLSVLVVAVLFVATVVMYDKSTFALMQFNHSSSGNDPTADTSTNVNDGTVENLPNVDKKQLSWRVDFDPAWSELSLLEHDVNHDGISDLILDSLTWRMGKNRYLVCPEKPNGCQEDLGFSPCRAQLFALDGSNGTIIWEKWVEFSTFAANCKHDLNLDGIPDCTFSGRVGLLAAINPVDGSYIWMVDPAVTFPMYGYYSPLFIRDFDRDGIIDLIVTHGGDPTYQPQQKHRSPGFIFVLSGRTGQQLSELIPMPDGQESYSSPVAYNVSGNVELVLFGSGGETVKGSLWAMTVQSLQMHVDNWTPNRAERYRPNKLYFDPLCISLKDIESVRPQSKKNTFKYLKNGEEWMTLCSVWSKDSRVMWNPYHVCVYEFLAGSKSGTMQPPVIVDYDGDGINDLLVTQFSEHTILIDGASVSTVWNHTATNTQSYRLVHETSIHLDYHLLLDNNNECCFLILYSIPAPLHYNQDNQLDFLVRINKGKWMFYDYSYMGVLDGESGELIWTLNCSMGVMSSPITVKSRKNGHDGMLFLANGCENPSGLVQKRDSNSFTKLKNEDKCSEGHTNEEYTACQKSDNKKKRHEEIMEGSDNDEVMQNATEGTDSENYFASIIKNLPPDLWEARNEADGFPDPWTDTRSFIQDYCDIPYDSMVNRVYYLTPNMIKSGLIQPVLENKPYVYSK